MKVRCQIQGIDTKESLKIENETAGYDRIVLIIGSEKITVYGKELMKAIRNCQNS